MTDSRILLLHLSDIHFLADDQNVSNRAPTIAAAVQGLLSQAKQVVILVTGDISQSGKPEQFAVAERFLASLVEDLRRRNVLSPQIVTVPGNHDADFDSPRCKVRSRVIQQLKSDPSSVGLEDIDECVSVFDAYHAFRLSVETMTPVVRSPIWQTVSLPVGARSLVIHCVNNAWNCEKRTEPGQLSFPMSLHDRCGEGEGEVRLLLMHHPAHWVSSRQYREFRRFTRECAEVCFTGHEHEANVGSNHDSDTGLTLYVEGAALQEHGGSTDSGFCATLLDVKERWLETTDYGWTNGHYSEVREAFRQQLPQRVEPVTLTPVWREFLTDVGSNLSHRAKVHLELGDIYVFPQLERQSDNEDDPVIVSSQVLSKELGQHGRSALIKGEQSSGKTALLKRLYSDAINAGYFPIYLHGERMKSSSDKELQRLLQKSVEEQYSQEHVSTVLQAYPERRILLLDNVDRYGFPDKYMSSVLENLSKQFGEIIATADSSFDMKEALLSGPLIALSEFEQLRLLEFGFGSRFELVSKWFHIASEISQAEHEVEQADKIISRVVGRGLVPSYPLYILILLQSIDIGRTGDLENSALGHYYEYMILDALKHDVRQEDVHEVLNYCSQFAWFLHSLKKVRVSDQEYRSFHAAFEARFDLQLNFQGRKDTLLRANLFLELGSQLGFRYAYSYYFFLGRYLSRHLANQETQSFIQECCRNLHVRENGNAMLFLAHHSNDRYVFDALREAVDARFVKVSPLQFQQDTEAIDRLVDAAPVLVFDAEKRKEGRESALEEDQRIERRFDDVANDDASADASDLQAKALELVSEINGLIKGIEILGTAIKTNFGSIDGDVKQELIGALFDGGLRALRVFVEAVSSAPDHLLAQLATAVDLSQSQSLPERERAIKVHLFSIVGRFAFWFIRRVGANIGSKSMAPSIARYVNTHDTVANRLIATASTLETPDRIPFKELQALNERVSKTAFAQSILRLIVFNRMYMYRTAEAEKQQIADELGIKVSSQHAIDYKTKSTRK